MKRYTITILFLFHFFISCEDVGAPDCLNSGGEITTQLVKTENFSALEINGRFEVVITDTTTSGVSITAPKNLIPEIQIEVINHKLIITDNNACDWVRSYDLPVINILSSNIDYITQNGAGMVRSSNTLTYPKIELVNQYHSGDFALDLNNEHVIISNNDISNFYLSGETNLLTIGFFAGDGRCECDKLRAKNVSVFQRGTNDMVVFPLESLWGRILGTGNLIYKNKPTHIDIVVEGRGQLIDGSNG
ncbi:MAG: head GIN domain-containing protein [Fulvivirga sp.]|nr:head GIN domain-containing protein [Fulvivirga sp.]